MIYTIRDRTSGRSITSRYTTTIALAAARYTHQSGKVEANNGRVPAALVNFEYAINDGRLQDAGNWADELGLDLDLGSPPQPTYAVPVDPAEATNCEACQ